MLHASFALIRKKVQSSSPLSSSVVFYVLGQQTFRLNPRRLHFFCSHRNDDCHRQPRSKKEQNLQKGNLSLYPVRVEEEKINFREEQKKVLPAGFFPLFMHKFALASDQGDFPQMTSEGWKVRGWTRRQANIVGGGKKTFSCFCQTLLSLKDFSWNK